MQIVTEYRSHRCETLDIWTEIYCTTSEFYTPSVVRGPLFNEPLFGVPWSLIATVVSEPASSLLRVRRGRTYP